MKSNIYFVSSFHFIPGITWFRNDDIHQGYYENDKPHGNGQKKYVILTRQKTRLYIFFNMTMQHLIVNVFMHFLQCQMGCHYSSYYFYLFT